MHNALARSHTVDITSQPNARTECFEAQTFTYVLSEHCSGVGLLQLQTSQPERVADDRDRAEGHGSAGDHRAEEYFLKHNIAGKFLNVRLIVIGKTVISKSALSKA